MNLPDRYLGALIRNGYFISEKADVPEQTIFVRFLEAAENGDEIAKAVLNNITFLSWHIIAMAGRLGVAVYPDIRGDGVTLKCNTYPPRFSGPPYDHIAEKARNGDYLAERFIAWVAINKFTNPDFKVYQ